MIWEFLTGMVREFLTVIRRLISRCEAKEQNGSVSSSSSSSLDVDVSQLNTLYKGMRYQYNSMGNLFGVSSNAIGLRFHAFGSRRGRRFGTVRYNSSKAQALIFFNLRYRLDFETNKLKEEDMYHQCQRRLICNLAKLKDEKFLMTTIRNKLSQMGLPDAVTNRVLESWAKFVDFACVAYLFAHFNGSKRMTMIAYIGGSEHKDKKKDEICAICHDDLRSTIENGGVLTLPCSHLFHGACLAPLLEQKLQCPLCKSKFSYQKYSMS